MFICEFGCSFGIFLNSANLICRSTDISKCFRGSLRLRDNESRLYIDSRTTHDKDNKFSCVNYRHKSDCLLFLSDGDVL